MIDLGFLSDMAISGRSDRPVFNSMDSVNSVNSVQTSGCFPEGLAGNPTDLNSAYPMLSIFASPLVRSIARC
jgi:hypothetical protein